MKIIIILALLLPRFGFSQKLSKKEKIKQYMDSIGKYLPADLRKYRLLALDPTNEEVTERLRIANYHSYVANGIDTLSKPEPFLSYELDFLKNEKKTKQGLALDKGLKKELDPVLVKTKDLEKFDATTYPYLLDFEYVSTKPSPGHLGFVVTRYYFVRDRLKGKRYKTPDDDRRINLNDLIK